MATLTRTSNNPGFITATMGFLQPLWAQHSHPVLIKATMANLKLTSLPGFTMATLGLSKPHLLQLPYVYHGHPVLITATLISPWWPSTPSMSGLRTATLHSPQTHCIHCSHHVIMMSTLISSQPLWAYYGHLSSPWPPSAHHEHPELTTNTMGTPQSPWAHISHPKHITIILGSQCEPWAHTSYYVITMATLSSSKPLWAHPGLTTIFTLGSTWTLLVHYGDTGFTIAILGLPWISWAQHGNPQHTTANLGSQIYNWHLQIYSSELQIYHNPNINCHYLWNWMSHCFLILLVQEVWSSLSSRAHNGHPGLTTIKEDL